MKRLATIALLVLLISCSCPAEEPQEQTWTCSMHPEVTAPRAGSCPICALELVQAKDQPKDKPQKNDRDKSGEEPTNKAAGHLSIVTPGGGSSVRQLLAVLSTQGKAGGHKPLIPSKNVDGNIDLQLQNVTWQEALEAVLAAGDLVAVEGEKSIRLYTAEEARKMNLPNVVNPWAQGETIHGTVKNNALRTAAPDNGVITSEQQLQALLKTWGADNTSWTTDFAENFVFVQTVSGPNRIILDYRFEKTDRNLMVMVGSTRMAGPGFGWAMQAVRKDGIKQINGKPVDFAAPEADVLVSASDAGKTRQVSRTDIIVIDLEGNPTTGYAWVLESIDGQAVRQVGSIKYIPPKDEPDDPEPRPGRGGTFHATFEAVKVGKATVTLAYRRPWEKDAKPAKTFTVTFDVGRAKARTATPAEPAADAARAVTVTVRLADEKPRYTLLGTTHADLTKLLAALKQAKADGATEVLIDITRDTPHKHLADVLNVARAAGFAKVGMKASDLPQ
jgi:predicted secreted protein